MMTNVGAWKLRFLALILAVFAWYLVSGREKVETWVELPLEFINLPQESIIRSGLPSRIQVRIRGTRGLIHAKDIQRMAYTLDLRNLQVGTNVFILGGEDIPLSSALSVVEISPPRLEIEVDKLIYKSVPVRVQWKAETGDDFSFIGAVTSPATVILRGAKTLLDKTSEVLTQEVEIKDKNLRLWTGRLGLLLPDEVKSDSGDVDVQLYFGPKTKSIWVKKDILFEVPKGFNVEIEPEFARVEVDLPLDLFKEKDWRDKIKVYLDLQAMPPGEHDLLYKVRLPQDSLLLNAKPTRIKVNISKIPSEPDKNGSESTTVNKG